VLKLGLVLGALASAESCVTILLSEPSSFDAYDAAVQPGTFTAVWIAMVTVAAFLVLVVKPARVQELGPGVGLVASTAYAGFFALFTWWCFAWVEARSVWWILAWFGAAFGTTFLTARATVLAMQYVVRAKA
jgi:hypothetical protein